MPVAVGRLKRRSEFLRVAGLRRKWAAPGLLLQAAPAKAPPVSPEKSASPAQPGEDAVSVIQPRDAGAGPGEAGKASSCLDGLRVGFTVSRKVGNAVKRNRARRRLKAAAEQIMPVHAAPGYDYVVIGRQDTLDRPFALLLLDFQAALKRLGLFRAGGNDPSPVAKGKP